jgi:hypothetical protein
MKRAAILTVALLAAACTEEAAAPADQRAAAAGEVLGGEISDATLAPQQAPAAADVDAEQPEITPAEGIEGGPPSEGAEPATAAPAPEPAE